MATKRTNTKRYGGKYRTSDRNCNNAFMKSLVEIKYQRSPLETFLFFTRSINEQSFRSFKSDHLHQVLVKICWLEFDIFEMIFYIVVQFSLLLIALPWLRLQNKDTTAFTLRIQTLVNFVEEKLYPHITIIQMYPFGDTQTCDNVIFFL